MSAATAPAPTRLWLVRHGETDWNRAGRYQGQADIPLNANGLAQARALPPTFSGLPIAAIYSSDLQRAAVTAGVIAAALKLPVIVHPGLREVSLGQWEGMLHTDIQAQYPEHWQARRNDPVHAHPPGGESLGEVAARAFAAADELARQHPGQQIILVSHALLLASLICKGRGIPLDQAFQHVPPNCCAEPVDWVLV